MKNLTNFITVLAFIAFFALPSCNNAPKTETENQGQQEQTQQATVSEFDLMLKQIQENGDYINSDLVPSLISAQDLKSVLDSNVLLVDIRTPKDFADAHIKGSRNAKLSELVDYAYENAFSDFSKVVLICYSGQTASYAASVLRLIGYDNVFALKYGMCSWNAKTAHKWLENISDKYATQLVTTPTPKNAAGAFPTIEMGKTDGSEILEARAQEVLKKGFAEAIIKIDIVMADPTAYYLINYVPEEIYTIGHLPDAIQYTPAKSLGAASELNTLPTDKPIVIYGYTGQTAAFVAAYLNILGYDAKIVAYGANSFMNALMGTNKEIGHNFTKKDIMNYPVEHSEFKEKAGEKAEVGGC